MANEYNIPLTRQDRRQAERLKIKSSGGSRNPRRNLRLWLIVGGIVALIGAAWWFAQPVSKTPQSKPLDVRSDDWVQGPATARATLVEYLDFECEACGAYYPVVKQLRDELKDDLRIVYRYNPLPGHKNGLPAALAVEAAGKQGKYFEMHTALFENQKTWGEGAKADPTIFETYAQSLGLDMAQFKTDAASTSVRERVDRDLATGRQLGVTGTPTFFLNGEKIQNPRSFEDFKTLVQAAILKAPNPDAPKLGEKVHEHADFAIYLDGKKFDFTPPKYQSSEDNPLDPDAHLHDGNGDVTHKHRRGITLGYFFKTLGMSFDDACFATDATTKFCTDGTKTLKFFVNGQANTEFGKYEFTDLDRILISYGSEDSAQIQKQFETITDQACLFSEKCPERGIPPTENCVGGLGSDC